MTSKVTVVQVGDMWSRETTHKWDVASHLEEETEMELEGKGK